MRNKLSAISNKLSASKGFTLIELIISFGILTVLLSVLMGIFGSILDVQLESKAKSSIDQDVRYILAKLGYDMHAASSIETPENPGPSTSLILTNSLDSINYTYSLDANNNLQIVNNNTSEVNVLNSIDDSISNLNFERVGAGGSDDTIRVTFTIQSKIKRPSGQETRSIQTTLGLP